MSLIDDIKLIEEVKKFPLLYDSKFRGQNATKEKVWVRIAGKLNVTPADAKNRWRSLRDKFAREKKLLSAGCESEQSQRSGPANPPWPLLDHMSFIWNYIVHRRRFTTNSIKKELNTYASVAPRRDYIKDTTEWVVSLDDDDEDENSEEKQDSQVEDPKTKKQTKQMLQSQEQPMMESADFCHTSDDDKSYAPNLGQSFNSQQNIADAEHYFCMSVAETLRRFTSRQKAEAKLKIQQILYETEFGPDSTETVATFEETFME